MWDWDCLLLLESLYQRVPGFLLTLMFVINSVSFSSLSASEAVELDLIQWLYLSSYYCRILTLSFCRLVSDLSSLILWLSYWLRVSSFL